MDQLTLSQTLRLQKEHQIHPSQARALFVGEAPGPNTHRDLPLFPWPPTSAGGRLHALTGLPLSSYFQRVARTNLFYEYPGPRWDVALARVRAQQLLEKHPSVEGRTLVFVGAKVAAAFGLSHVLPTCKLGWWPAHRTLVAYIPHTSGLNRAFNNPSVTAKVSEFVSSLLLDGSLNGACLPPELVT